MYFCKVFVYFLLLKVVYCNYWTEREQILKNEETMTIGGSLILNHNENIVNEFLMEKKRKEFDNGVENPNSFIASQHLFDTLELIEKSDVFRFIRKLPKGGLLHGHDTALASGSYLYNLTFSDDLYACITENKIKLKFLKKPKTQGNCAWTSISVLRHTYSGFDELLKAQLTLIRKDYRDAYTNINVVWQHFLDIFSTVEPLICYRPIFQEYFYQVLKELHDDNVFYIEFRTTLPTVYDLDGRLYGPIEVAGLYEETVKEFMCNHPDFLGARMIYAPIRGVTNETMDTYVETVKDLKTAFPCFLAGFDLVGQEDLGRPLIEFIDQLEEIKNEVNLFFHAGETNWFGSSTDENLIDAVLLGTTRIGHGYAILKRPEILQIVKDKNIAIEICPISNQVLHLVNDLRNHPANYLIANDFPIVISNDDPSFWGTSALSYDWYIAFMGMTSKKTDLRFLKQLAINSIQYSVYEDKTFAMDEWENKWNEFINSFVATLNEIREK